MNKIKNILKRIFFSSGTVEKLTARFNIGFSLQKKLKNKVPKIGIAVLIWERPEYLEYCLDTLFKTKIEGYDVTFLLNDDGSTDPRVKEIMEKERDAKYKIVRNYTEKGHGSWGAAFNKAMKKLLELDDFDIVGTCDSDALFHPDWLDKSIKVMTWAKGYHKDHKLIKFSPFNSSNFEFHRFLGKYKSPFGDYVVKERMGDVASFYFKDDLIKIGFYAEDRDDETLMTTNFKKWLIRNFSTDITYVDHIGHISLLNQWRPTPVEVAVHGMNLEQSQWPVDPWKFRYLEKEYYSNFDLDYKRYIYQVNLFNSRGGLIRLTNFLYRVVRKVSDSVLVKLFRKENNLLIQLKAKTLENTFGFDADFKRITAQGSSDLKLDVVIPTVAKDLDILQFVVKGIRKHLKHPIGKIIIVAPAKGEIIEFAQNNECEFIDEDTVLPVRVSDINYNAGGLNRSGWLFQQLLKLSGEPVSKNDHYLVVDADYIMTSDRVFEENGKFVFDTSEEFHKNYFNVYTKMMGYPAESPVSFVTHHMLLSQEYITKFKHYLEDKHKKYWYEVIIELADRSHYSGFSEYETYANFLLKNFPESIKLEYWHNLEIQREDLVDLQVLNKWIQKAESKFKSITVSNPLIIRVDGNIK